MLRALGAIGAGAVPTLARPWGWALSVTMSTPGSRKDFEDIGDFRISKFLLLIGYCAQAIWCRFRYGVTKPSISGAGQTLGALP